MNEIILAMKPKWLHLIIERKKTCEVRRTGPKVVPDWLFLYQGGCIHGLAHVVGVVKPVILKGAAMIGAETLREACLTQEQFMGYMARGRRHHGSTSWEALRRSRALFPFRAGRRAGSI